LFKKVADTEALNATEAWAQWAKAQADEMDPLLGDLRRL
jgi:hypothetical protein